MPDLGEGQCSGVVGFHRRVSRFHAAVTGLHVLMVGYKSAVGKIGAFGSSGISRRSLFNLTARKLAASRHPSHQHEAQKNPISQHSRYRD